MDTFTTNDDLKTLRPSILDMGIDDFAEAHSEAFRIIDRELRLWHLQSAITRMTDSGSTTNSLEEAARTAFPYDNDYFLEWEAEIKPAAIRLALSFAYLALSKDLPMEEDGLAYQANYFRGDYDKEWALAVRSGFSYDWDASGTIESTEVQISYRSLVRQ